MTNSDNPGRNNPNGKKKLKKGKLFQTKSGRWITPQDRKKNEIKGANDSDVDDEVQETISQIDVDIPGMVVLKSKEDRHLGRLNQDMKAKEEFKKQTKPVRKPPPLPDMPGDISGRAPVQPEPSGIDPDLFASGQVILDRMVEKQNITVEQKNEVIALASDKGILIEEAVSEKKLMAPHDLGTFIAGECKIPFSNLEVLRVSPKVKDILDREQMLQFRVIPLSKIGPTLNVAAVNPLDNPVIEQLKTESGYEVKCIVCTPSTFDKTLEAFNG